jgi:hypothetical protein
MLDLDVWFGGFFRQDFKILRDVRISLGFLFVLNLFFLNTIKYFTYTHLKILIEKHRFKYIQR